MSVSVSFKILQKKKLLEELVLRFYINMVNFACLCKSHQRFQAFGCDLNILRQQTILICLPVEITQKQCRDFPYTWLVRTPYQNCNLPT